MTQKFAHQAFKNPDGKYTLYDFEIAETDEGRPYAFVIRSSPHNEGPPINDDMIVNTARTMAQRFKLEAHQVAVFAEKADGSFSKCSFRTYRPGQDNTAIIDFTHGGGAKVPVTREFVEDYVAPRKEQEPQAAPAPDLSSAEVPTLESVFQRDDPEREP